MNIEYRYTHTSNGTVTNLDNNYDENIRFVSGFDYHDQPNLNFRSTYLEKEKSVETALEVLNYLFKIFNSSYYLLNFSTEYFEDELDYEKPMVKSPFLGLRLDEFYDNQNKSYWINKKSNLIEIQLRKPEYDISAAFNCKISNEKYQKNIFSYGLYMSQYSDIFESILLFLSEDQTYTTLSSILDSIKMHIHNNNIKLKEFYGGCGYNESDINRFSKTCNNYSIVGIQGRHGVTNMNKLDDTDKLPLGEAKMMIHKMSSYLFNNYRCITLKSK